MKLKNTAKFRTLRNKQNCHYLSSSWITGLELICSQAKFELINTQCEVINVKGHTKNEIIFLALTSWLSKIGESLNTWWKQCRNSVCSRNSPQPCLDPPNSKCHDGQRQITEAGKYIRENTAFRTKFRGDVRIQLCHAAVWIEFAFGRLGVITTQAS